MVTGMGAHWRNYIQLGLKPLYTMLHVAHKYTALYNAVR